MVHVFWMRCKNSLVLRFFLSKIWLFIFYTTPSPLKLPLGTTRRLVFYLYWFQKSSCSFCSIYIITMDSKISDLTLNFRRIENDLFLMCLRQFYIKVTIGYLYLFLIDTREKVYSHKSCNDKMFSPLAHSSRRSWLNSIA